VGYAAVDEATSFAAIEKAYANGWQILTHANGDAAIQSLLDGIRAAQAKHPGVANRPVLIHGQTAREDQVEAMRELGVFPSLFPMHTYYWGDWHRDHVIGAERAENISPLAWVRERGMIFGSHHDAPVALPDSMRVLSATVTRVTRTGKVLGAQHRVDVTTALKALSLWPAWQHFEEKTKGSIEVGKLADFVVLSANPLTVDPAKLAELKVEQTIKEDRVIYQRDERALALGAPTPAVFGVGGNPARVQDWQQTQARLHASLHEHAAEGTAASPAMTVCGDGCFAPALAVIVHALPAKPAREAQAERATTTAPSPAILP
jgi:predicted amidohydrolase YtcJ